MFGRKDSESTTTQFTTKGHKEARQAIEFEEMGKWGKAAEYHRLAALNFEQASKATKDLSIRRYLQEYSEAHKHQGMACDKKRRVFSESPPGVVRHWKELAKGRRGLSGGTAGESYYMISASRAGSSIGKENESSDGNDNNHTTRSGDTSMIAPIPEEPRAEEFREVTRALEDANARLDRLAEEKLNAELRAERAETETAKLRVELQTLRQALFAQLSGEWNGAAESLDVKEVDPTLLSISRALRISLEAADIEEDSEFDRLHELQARANMKAWHQT